MFGLSQRGFAKDDIDPTKQCLRTHVSGLLLKGDCSAEQEEELKLLSLGATPQMELEFLGFLGISVNWRSLLFLNSCLYRQEQVAPSHGPLRCNWKSKSHFSWRPCMLRGRDQQILKQAISMSQLALQ